MCNLSPWGEHSVTKGTWLPSGDTQPGPTVHHVPTLRSAPLAQPSLGAGRAGRGGAGLRGGAGRGVLPADGSLLLAWRHPGVGVASSRRSGRFALIAVTLQGWLAYVFSLFILLKILTYYGLLKEKHVVSLVLEEKKTLVEKTGNFNRVSSVVNRVRPM